MLEYDPEKAKQLLAQAGFPNGIDLEWYVPFPPYFDMGERILTDLRAVGIRGKMQTLEGPVFRAQVAQGRKGYPGTALCSRTSIRDPGVPRPTLVSTPCVAAHPPSSVNPESRNCGRNIRPASTWPNGSA